MTTKDEALKLALEADKAFEKWWDEEGSTAPKHRLDCEEHCYQIAKIAWSNGAYKAHTAIKQTLAAPVQEPVAWMYEVNGAHTILDLFEPPDDAYDEGTLHPLYTTPPAAPVQEPPDDGFTQALIERDEYHAIADELAEMIARITGEDIGEHTSANFPWRNALDAAENWLCHPPAPTVQEPVAWMYWQSCLNDDGTQTAPWVQRYSKFKPPESVINKEITPLYTTPPAAQRQWVGLTDEDWQDISDKTATIIWSSLKQAVDDKLKEKNT